MFKSLVTKQNYQQLAIFVDNQDYEIQFKNDFCNLITNFNCLFYLEYSKMINFYCFRRSVNHFYYLIFNLFFFKDQLNIYYNLMVISYYLFASLGCLFLTNYSIFFQMTLVQAKEPVNQITCFHFQGKCFLVTKFVSYFKLSFYFFLVNFQPYSLILLPQSIVNKFISLKIFSLSSSNQDLRVYYVKTIHLLIAYKHLIFLTCLACSYLLHQISPRFFNFLSDLIYNVLCFLHFKPLKATFLHKKGLFGFNLDQFQIYFQAKQQKQEIQDNIFSSKQQFFLFFQTLEIIHFKLQYCFTKQYLSQIQFSSSTNQIHLNHWLYQQYCLYSNILFFYL
ncbi:transmembrane protein, putative (macronuclear) [Tetrahymena thermophila SB210]|uniref:Transmembrane protein, putative n=1 Tax=Tetrahymena thermophila (strain SB210) TaxID=312017 RepID=W7XE70_TETTS|nr:transmembrane protein, putative [Tetrahymena thermophila SB210]EWS74843.1 transmembrane protein, putative [Tetrahymena thermophila SB210]|eukprot:XP_012652556.1 transmembrane protein, putative [Tetrahymena thermophila SB210]